MSSYDNWAFKIFLCSTLFIVIFSVAAIQNWPPLAKHTSILLACILPAAMIVIVRVPSWFRKKEVPKEVQWALLVFVLGLISSILSENPWPTTKSTVLFIVSGPIIFIASRYLFEPTKNQNSFLLLTSLTLLGLSILGIYEHNYNNPKVGYQGILLFQENPLPAGAILFLLSASPLILLRRKQSTTLKFILLLSLTFSVASILLLSKKGPILGWVVTLLFLFILVNRKYILFLLGLIFITGSLLYFSDTTLSKYKNFFKLNASVTQRAESYFFGFHVFKENPLWGVGFKADFTPYSDDYILKFSDKKSTYGYQQVLGWNHTFENIFLGFLIEMGILFSIVYFGGVIYLVTVFFKKFRALPQSNLEGMFTIAIMVGFASISCTFDTLRFPSLNWLFHSFLGLMVNLPKGGTKISEKIARN